MKSFPKALLAAHINDFNTELFSRFLQTPSMNSRGCGSEQTPLGSTMQATSTVDAEVERHRQTWLGFCRFMRIMIVVIVLILVGMAIFLI